MIFSFFSRFSAFSSVELPRCSAAYTSRSPTLSLSFAQARLAHIYTLEPFCWKQLPAVAGNGVEEIGLLMLADERWRDEYVKEPAVLGDNYLCTRHWTHSYLEESAITLISELCTIPMPSCENSNPGFKSSLPWSRMCSHAKGSDLCTRWAQVPCKELSFWPFLSICCWPCVTNMRRVLECKLRRLSRHVNPSVMVTSRSVS